ncbi:MAG: amidohydrolase family protein [Granulosicoccus sp.]|nr:amidohydrolase family protein [Granulosicoccus sp.]
MTSQDTCIIIHGLTWAGSDLPCTVVLHDGIVTSVSTDPVDVQQLVPDADVGALVIDARGKLALPGMTDLYARLREPGLTRKGTIASETAAALAAGFTRVVCSPDTQPAIDSVATVELVHHRAAAARGARVIPMGALTVGLDGEQLSELATLQQAGCPVAGQADRPLESTNVLFSAMEYAASFDLPLFMTARDAQLGAGGCAHTGAIATRLGLPGIPVAAETVALARLLELCRETGCRLHVSRISSARSVQMMESAKQDALPVTCDVGLHHLFFTDEHVAGYDSLFHSAVPFRSRRDREALRLGVASGIIDAICTDHAPHDRDARLAPFPATEAGLSAYDWAIPLILQLPGVLQLTQAQVFEKFTAAPERIIDGSARSGLVAGQVADFFLLAENARIEQRAVVQSMAGMNHPLNVHSAASLGLDTLRGKVTHVFSQRRMHDLSKSKPEVPAGSEDGGW